MSAGEGVVVPIFYVQELVVPSECRGWAPASPQAIRWGLPIGWGRLVNGLGCRYVRVGFLDMKGNFLTPWGGPITSTPPVFGFCQGRGTPRYYRTVYAPALSVIGLFLVGSSYLPPTTHQRLSDGRVRAVSYRTSNSQSIIELSIELSTECGIESSIELSTELSTELRNELRNESSIEGRIGTSTREVIGTCLFRYNPHRLPTLPNRK